MEFQTWFIKEMNGLQVNCCILWIDIAPGTFNSWYLSFQNQFDMSEIILITLKLTFYSNFLEAHSFYRLNQANFVALELETPQPTWP